MTTFLYKVESGTNFWSTILQSVTFYLMVNKLFVTVKIDFLILFFIVGTEVGFFG